MSVGIYKTRLCTKLIEILHYIGENFPENKNQVTEMVRKKERKKNHSNGGQ